jgi:hypothetical protein
MAWSFHVTLQGVGIVATFSVLEDATQTARIASGLGALVIAIRSWRSSRPGPAWPDERHRRLVIAIWSIEMLFVLANVVPGSVGYLHVIMLVFLLEPASVFFAAIQDATNDELAAPPA